MNGNRNKDGDESSSGDEDRDGAGAGLVLAHGMIAEVLPARTFTFASLVEPLREAGLIKGGEG